MWVRNPVVPTAASIDAGALADDDQSLLARRVARMLTSKAQKRSGNVHLPVLNLVEHFFIRRDHGSGQMTTVGTEIHSPCQVLSSANTATVRNHWADWSALTARGCGVKLAAGQDALTEAIDAAPWRLSIVTKDNLNLNDALIGLEERRLAAEMTVNPSLVPDCNDMSLLSIECICHSAVLCQRPYMESQAGVPTALVKQGHCIESGRVHRLFVDALRSLIKKPGNFVYREVMELPAEASQHRKTNQRILELTRPLRDLSIDDEKLICDALNWDWAEWPIVHVCVKGKCPLGCAGSAKRSRSMVSDIIVLAVGGRMPVALLYRWKHFESASAYSLRGRRCYDFHLNALQIVYSKATVEKAENEATRLALLGQEPE
jgi:hypothetical protein